MTVDYSYTRVKAMGLVWRDATRAQLLLEQIQDPDGTLLGFRPLGGSIEFGEKSWEALERGFMEELGEDIAITRLHGVFENMFTWAGVPGHEIVFLYDTELLNKQTYADDIIERIDVSTDALLAKTAHWLNPFALPQGKPLFPLGLADQLKGAA